MTGKDLLETLLESFQASYDVERACDINGDIYEAYASFRAANARYVLVKSAELWRAECFEHVFFRINRMELTAETVDLFGRQVTDYIEPELVRHGEKWPPDRCKYGRPVYQCKKERRTGCGPYPSLQCAAVPEAAGRIRSFRYVKNYKMSIRGYSEARILVFDLKNRKLLGNRAARELVKGYKKSAKFWLDSI